VVGPPLKSIVAPCAWAAKPSPMQAAASKHETPRRVMLRRVLAFFLKNRVGNTTAGEVKKCPDMQNLLKMGTID
jgi:hypothetical protein